MAIMVMFYQSQRLILRQQYAEAVEEERLINKDLDSLRSLPWRYFRWPSPATGGQHRFTGRC